MEDLFGKAMSNFSPTSPPSPVGFIGQSLFLSLSLFPHDGFSLLSHANDSSASSFFSPPLQGLDAYGHYFSPPLLTRECVWKRVKMPYTTFPPLWPSSPFREKYKMEKEKVLQRWVGRRILHSRRQACRVWRASKIGKAFLPPSLLSSSIPIFRAFSHPLSSLRQKCNSTNYKAEEGGVERPLLRFSISFSPFRDNKSYSPLFPHPDATGPALPFAGSNSHNASSSSV